MREISNCEIGFVKYGFIFCLPLMEGLLLKYGYLKTFSLAKL